MDFFIFIEYRYYHRAVLDLFMYNFCLKAWLNGNPSIFSRGFAGHTNRSK